MKMSFRSFLTCAVLGLMLAVAGCADKGGQTISNVNQKKASGQTSSAQPYPWGQNLATSRLQPPASSLSNGQILSQSPAVQGAGTPPGVQSAPLVAAATAGGKARAAILLPLSGTNEALGQAMLNAAQQAVFDAAGNNFVLLPQDTAGPGGADSAARAALNGGIDIFIGPLFATDIPAVKSVAQTAGLPVLALSTDTSHADNGVYVLGLAPGQQVARIVAYAASRGAHSFAALVPNTPYGVLVGRAFREEVSRVGGSVSVYEIYGGAGEAADRARALAAQAGTIDALFLPDSSDNLKSIADALAAGGLNTARTHLLGMGLWDVPNFGQQQPFLAGAWYAAPDPAARKAFVSNYAAAFGSEPPRLATLAYDATALAALLAKRGARYDEASLTNPNGFAGVDGIFRLFAGGGVERALAVNEVTPAGAKVIDAAPTSFVGRAAK